MATKTFNVTKQMMSNDGTLANAANPGDLHIPLGRWASIGYDTRALLYAPISFSGMTGIIEARLYLNVHAADGSGHVNGVGNSYVGVRRKTSGWSESSAGTSTSEDEVWGGNGASLVTTGYVDAGDGLSVVDADASNGALVYVDITETVKDWFNGSANHGVMIFAADSDGTAAHGASDAFEAFSRHYGGQEPYIWISYDTNTAPEAPVNLSPTGSETRHTGSSVTMSGTRSDADGGDYISQYQIQVYEDGGTPGELYNQYINPGGSPTTFSKTVSGLPTNTWLRWRARTADGDGEWGDWSAGQRFKLNTTPSAPSVTIDGSPDDDLMDLTPTIRITHSDPDPGDKAEQYQIVVETSDGATEMWNPGEVTPSSPLATVVVNYAGDSLDWGGSYRVKARTKDTADRWSAWSSWVYFGMHKTGAPINLSPTGGIETGGITPSLSGQRATSADSLDSAQIQVYSSDGVTLVWDSGEFSSGVTSTGFTKAYGGTALSYATSYLWRARVTGDDGGTSDWSALQAFDTPAADAILMSAPLGLGITDLTPDFEFSRTDSFNAYQIVLYEADGVTEVWDSGTETHVSATSRDITYPGTPALEWATEYKWKVRVSSDSGSTWGNGYTALVSFTTEEAGVPNLLIPSDNAWIGTFHLDMAESLDDVTGSAESTVTLETTVLDEGKAAYKAAITSLNGTTAAINIARAFDLSDYGAMAQVIASVRASDLTNVTNIRLRFIDGAAAYAEYDIKPSLAGAWEEPATDKGSPDASSGTIDWSDIVELEVQVTTGASVSFDLYVDDIRVDASLPSFDGESTGGETIDTVRIVVYAADQTTEVWDSGDISVSDTEFSVQYDGPTLVTGQTYYWTAQYTEDTGPTGGFAPMRAFAINAAPNVPGQIWPNADAVIADDLDPMFEMYFADPDQTTHGDLPRVVEVEVYRNSDSVLMHTLRSVGDLDVYTTLERDSEGTALSYEVEYKFRVRFADSFGEYGAWSSYIVFTPSESPTVVVTAPVSTIISPQFDVDWTFDSPADKSQNRYRVTVRRSADDVQVYDSGVIFSSELGHTVPGGFLKNSTEYIVAVTAYDSDALPSVAAEATFETAWAAPDAVGGFSVSALVETSEILLSWSQSAMDSSDFSYYQIYRRELGTGDWEKYQRITDQFTTEWSDYFAGHGVSYEYKITVWKVVAGDVDIESGDSEVPVAILDPDAWFVVGTDRNPAHIFELPVWDESHTQPLQQEVFEPLGSSRKAIVRGKVLGAEGTLQVQWTTDERAAAKVYLRFLTDTAGPHILKSPFGDVWSVEFSGPGEKYTGGGHLGVTLTWIEVA